MRASTCIVSIIYRVLYVFSVSNKPCLNVVSIIDWNVPNVDRPFINAPILKGSLVVSKEAENQLYLHHSVSTDLSRKGFKPTFLTLTPFKAFFSTSSSMYPPLFVINHTFQSMTWSGPHVSNHIQCCCNTIIYTNNFLQNFAYFVCYCHTIPYHTILLVLPPSSRDLSASS